MMAGYNRELIQSLQDQGATIRKTKKGLMIYGPSGGTVTIHNTPSDRRSLPNEIADLRRIGLEHPEASRPPKKKHRKLQRNAEGYPTYITDSITTEKKATILAALMEMGWPLEVMVKDLPSSVGPNTTVARGLYAVGYRWKQDGKKRDRTWIAPDDIRDLHEKMKAAESEKTDMTNACPECGDQMIGKPRACAKHGIPKMAKRVDAVDENGVAFSYTSVVTSDSECAHDAWEELPGGSRRCADCKEFLPPQNFQWVEPPNPERIRWVEPPKPERIEVKKENGREFIDSHESWTVNIDSPKPGTRDYVPAEVRNYLAGLRAAGLEVEIRVWRKS